jgi:hypothetical protein
MFDDWSKVKARMLEDESLLAGTGSFVRGVSNESLMRLEKCRVGAQRWCEI